MIDNDLVLVTWNRLNKSFWIASDYLDNDRSNLGELFFILDLYLDMREMLRKGKQA